MRGNSLYQSTYVYGNILVEHDGQGNRQIVHYGGDSGKQSQYRKGILYFYHNTVYSDRSKNTLLRLSSNSESADLRNNIIVANNLGIVDSSGIGNLQNNWLTAGWVNSHSSLSAVLLLQHQLKVSTPVLRTNPLVTFTWPVVLHVLVNPVL